MYIYRVDETLSTTSSYYNNADYDLAVAKSSTNHYPFYDNFIGSNITFSVNLALTQMPIPTQNTPFLLNFTGAAVSMTIDWKTPRPFDPMFLIAYLPTANPSVDIVIDVTDIWGGIATTANKEVMNKFNLGQHIGTGGVARFNAVVNNFSITQQAGEILWSCQASFYIGLMVG